MDSIYAIFKAIWPVFLNCNILEKRKFLRRIFRLKSDSKFKGCVDRTIPKQQFRIHGLSDTFLIPP